MVFCVLIFIYWLEVTLGYTDESDIHHCNVIFFRKGYSKSYWITAMLKFLFNNYEAHLQPYFEGHPTVEDFMDMDQDTC